ncbi:hypothetical protein Taro_022780 [Colocasia esculenta]|uniref:Uncharacterized protein n=1 Tax=Colocasia esculenta TaxID=4460 RepID=A0A843UVD8_COLES|nr:hypothetical protein [Colocasia esculenta]
MGVPVVIQIATGWPSVTTEPAGLARFRGRECDGAGHRVHVAMVRPTETRVLVTKGRRKLFAPAFSSELPRPNHLPFVSQGSYHELGPTIAMARSAVIPEVVAVGWTIAS